MNNWLNKIRNLEAIPKINYAVYEEDGYLMISNIHDIPSYKGRTLVFESYFVAEWYCKNYHDGIHDYRECLPKKGVDYRFWVILETPNCFFADDIIKTQGYNYKLRKYEN